MAEDYSTVRGDKKAIRRSNASTEPGYSTEKSRPGVSSGQMKSGVIDKGKITGSTGSDPAMRNMPIDPDQ